MASTAVRGGDGGQPVVPVLVRVDEQRLSRQMDVILHKAIEQAEADPITKGYATSVRLSSRLAGAGGVGAEHGGLTLLDSRQQCVLCKLTLQLADDDDLNDFMGETEESRLLTEYQCKECNLPMHRSCAWYWHNRKSPYSRYVSKVVEHTMRQWPLDASVLAPFTRESHVLRADGPGDGEGAESMLSKLEEKWSQHDRLYALNGNRHEHEFVKGLDVNGDNVETGDCMLCKLTQEVWPVDGGNAVKKPKKTAYKCKKCGVFLHIDCYSFWHEELVPYSRIVWRARVKDNGPVVDERQATALVGAIKDDSVEKRLSRDMHKLVSYGGHGKECRLCKLSAKVMGVDINRIDLASAGCETCGTALHRDCAKLWHSEIVPYSRRVFGKVAVKKK